MQFRKCSGIIIGVQRRGECDRSISLFTAEYGRLYVTAKGVRTIRSKRSYHIDLFNSVDVEIQETARGLYLREISTNKSFASIAREPEQFSGACLISSFLQRSIPLDTPQPILYEITLKTFEVLSGKCITNDVLLTYFLKCARHLGFLPNNIAKKDIRQNLLNMFQEIDPQFTLNARSTLGIFSI